MDQINSTIGVICYKYSYTLDYVLTLSIPQLYYLQTQLANIIKLENGGSKEDKSDKIPNDANTNTEVLGATLEYMKKVTGKSSFTLAEMQNPGLTIKNYSNTDK